MPLLKAKIYTVTPKDLEQDVHIEVTYPLVRPQDDAQALQNYHSASDGPNAAYTREQARQKYLHEERNELIEDELLVQAAKDDPEIRNKLKAQVMAVFDAEIEQRKLAKEQQFTLDQLTNATPAVAEWVAMQATPGSPGYAAAQQFLMLLQQQQAQQPGVSMTPRTGVMGSASPVAMQPDASMMAAPPTQPTTEAAQPAQRRMPRGNGGRAAGAARQPGGAKMTGGLP